MTSCFLISSFGLNSNHALYTIPILIDMDNIHADFKTVIRNYMNLQYILPIFKKKTQHFNYIFYIYHAVIKDIKCIKFVLSML